MRKNLAMVLALVLVAVLSAPALGATLDVSGKYVGKIEYDKGTIKTGGAEGIDFLRMSTLYLNLDFAEGEAMSAHIPLKFTAPDGDVTAALNGDDNYLFVFRGTPLALSLTDATEGEYFFEDLGDPMGLVKYLNPDPDRDEDEDTYEGYATLKIAGNLFGVGVTSYFIATDPTGNAGGSAVATYPRYAMTRATYGLESGHTIGATYALREDAADDLHENIEVDAKGPLPVSEGANFTAAFAMNRNYALGAWETPINALKLNVADVGFGNFTFSGNVRAIGPDFEPVAPKESTPGKSDILDFIGVRQLQGEIATGVDLAGQAVTLTLGDDYRVNYDGTIGEGSTNKVYGKAEFSPSEPVGIEVGASYRNWLIASGSKKDDYRTNVYGKATYKPAENLEVKGGAEWMGAKQDSAPGSGFKLDGEATFQPIEGVTLEGNAAYQAGTWDFLIDTPAVVANQTRLDAEAYAEARQAFVPAGIKQVDTVVAGLARGTKLGSADAATTLIGYAEANLVLNDLFSDKIAVLGGKSTEDGFEDHYKTTLYNKFTYKVSGNSTLALDYIYQGNDGALDASYTVKLGDSSIKLAYGKTGIPTSPCEEDFDDGRPWAWFCEAAPVLTAPYYYSLTITIPF